MDTPSCIFQEQPLMSHHTRDIWASQRTANQVIVQHESGKITSVNCDISVTNISMTDLNLILTNGRSVLVYKIQKQNSSSGLSSSMDNTIKLIDDNREINLNDDLNVKLMNSFNCESVQIFLYEQNIICLNQNDVKILSLNGVKLQEIQFSENEGKIDGFSYHNLSAVSCHSLLKISRKTDWSRFNREIFNDFHHEWIPQNL